MSKTKRHSEHKLHAVLITFSVIAGLALAACQPKTVVPEATPLQTPVLDERVLQTSPAPVPAQTGSEGGGSMDQEIDAALLQMDGSIKAGDPSNVTGSDLQ